MVRFTIVPYFFILFFSDGYILNTVGQRSFNNETIQAANVNTFFNVISQVGADPWVYKHTDGYYYMTHTTGSNVCIWRSRLLTAISASPCKVVWKPSGSGEACKAIWAPELHFVQSAW